MDLQISEDMPLVIFNLPRDNWEIAKENSSNNHILEENNVEAFILEDIRDDDSFTQEKIEEIVRLLSIII